MPQKNAPEPTKEQIREEYARARVTRPSLLGGRKQYQAALDAFDRAMQPETAKKQGRSAASDMSEADAYYTFGVYYC